MRRLVKFIFTCGLITVLGLIGYSYLGDMTPTQSAERISVDLPASEGDG